MINGLRDKIIAYCAERYRRKYEAFMKDPNALSKEEAEQLRAKHTHTLDSQENN